MIIGVDSQLGTHRLLVGENLAQSFARTGDPLGV
jgi:hypothetical protein